jgi:putative membrane protein
MKKVNYLLNNAMPVFFLIVFSVCWLIFYQNCIDKTDWWLENILVIIGLIFLFSNRRFFKFNNTSYCCICCFMLLHIYGAMYAYTQNLFGEWLQNRFQLQRNPYDRIVHCSFGLFLFIPISDYLKNKILVKDKFLVLLTLLIILSLASGFELIEWLVAEFTTKETGETYVATQGDVWDAHKDIVLALLGGIITATGVKWKNRKITAAAVYQVH